MSHNSIRKYASDSFWALYSQDRLLNQYAHQYNPDSLAPNIWTG